MVKSKSDMGTARIILTGILKYHSGILKRSHQVQYGISIVSGGDILKYLDITLSFLIVLPLYVGIQYILVFKAQRAPTRSRGRLWYHTCCGVFSEKNYPPKAGPKDFRKGKEEKEEKRKGGGRTRLLQPPAPSPSKPRVASSFPSAHARE